ncbi:bifunctional DNA-formamidopyrimidine glycosylase/DNA-(apurinic or apyrimidinic site) lyase [Macrococcus caseolyticus]|uniref:bifunctional DNA-formamidopyrimidine glycosylase/DNA-(apurinic or apyrimidinic site) lyase n=1 Tax=Macrococcoides caseolyticum TaxID=69966 RepID=UPI0011A08D19|nr:bifunctional DNA-formamidopyrimidine glycosylase/DNA-(apurinic or apyrimidinic site) lyase [Macrococcus caseolyticus]MDJ1088105.1 bifunctional DNA-formamidopyrimidine glycosylase/DNA-(apurinic or apyrimidinic site) lyase [Macrococcus caseolyticus]MDJ1090770.1 bifunctional DNA-formamidopyrimidine glycosylase/DNA-(apurinic or apyrimidinic site) lyase [Macrococcus caseolyticus]MDJ1152624.1 bifunctional DNA-formamidopyrimidine glycosylase/DNA-(apurinic or apyrimidinic site) lyase [Macrococcus cas
MPELPEVEHVKRGIEPHITGERIIDVHFSDAVSNGKTQGKETIVKGLSLDAFKERCIDTHIESVMRRSKYIIFKLKGKDGNRYMVGHLGMTGAYFVVPSIDDIIVPNYKKHWHVTFTLSSSMKLVYSDIRRFGELRMLDESQFAHFDATIAPEPFSEEGRAHYISALHLPKYQDKPIKQVIMLHSVVSGCGNIYACEALHNAGINPNITVKKLSEKRRTLLYEHIVDVLNEGILYGGSTISDYRNAQGESGTMQNRFKVYGKKICGTCGNEIKTKVIATRNTHYCTHCQK